MPAKSRRNRRNISQSRKTVAGPNITKDVPVSPELAPQPEKSVATATYRSAPKAAADPAITYPYIMNEIKWIGIVTAIVAIVLVIFYMFFH